MMDVPVAFSLIVCTVGRRRPLLRLLNSLTKQRFQDFELIIVDQTPTDSFIPIIEREFIDLDIRIIRSERGLSRARNVGLQHARGPLIAFPDDDCWYRDDTISRVQTHLKSHPEVSLVAGRTLDASGRPSVSPFLDSASDISRRNFLKCGNSNCLFLRREVFERIGGFDEHLGVGAETPFQSGEEADLILRALAGGLSLRFIPDLVVHHDQVDATIGESQIERARRYGAGFGALLKKHGFSRSYVLYRLARPLLSAAGSFFRGDLPLTKYKCNWSRGILEGYRGWLRECTPTHRA
jgi:glycosyltransferase involved in cell wall biosynthesis